MRRFWTGVKSAILLLSLINVTNCKTKSKEDVSDYDLCMRNKEYIWDGASSSCLPRDAKLSAKQRCLQSEPGAVWDKDTCFSADQMNAAKSTCLGRGDGSTWVPSGEGAFRCLSPAQIATNEESCKLKGASYRWDTSSKLCLDAAGQACVAGGDYWTFDNRCVKPAEHFCSQKLDGSRYIGGVCMGPDEVACAAFGYHRKWVIDAATKKGECSRKSFLEMCSDPAAPDDIKQSLKVIFKTVAAASCDQANERLMVQGSLTLDDQQIKTLVPLLGFKNIQKISLQNNGLTDLKVVEEMTQITDLYLADNRLNNLFGIEKLVELKSLYLAENEIYDLKPLGSLPKLVNLYLNKNKIKSLASLFEAQTIENKGLAKLSILDVSDNCGLTELGSIEKLPSLTTLILNKTGVEQSKLAQSLVAKFEFFQLTNCY